MPPITNTHGNQIWASLYKEWRDLGRSLDGITNAVNHPAIIRTLLNIGALHTQFVEIEKPLRIKNLITYHGKTSNELDNMDDAEITNACELFLPDILHKLHKLAPLHTSPDIAKCIPPLMNAMTAYANKPDMRHRMYLADPVVVLPHLMNVISILTFIDNLSSPIPDFERQFSAMTVDAILYDERFFEDSKQILCDSQERAEKVKGLSADQMSDFVYREQQAKMLKKCDSKLIRAFAMQEPKSKLLYSRSFMDWAERLIQQVSFYYIKYPLEDTFHSRHGVVDKIIQETVKYIHHPELSTIHRMTELAQFILKLDIGNRTLFKLLVPVLQEVPTLERYPVDLYGNDKQGRLSLIQKLEEFKGSERYEKFEQGYEQHHAFLNQPKKDTPEKLKKPRHQPLEPITPAEIKLRLRKLPSNILNISPEPLSSNAFRRFANWLRGLLTQGKIREHMIQEIKKLDSSVQVTTQGFVKRPPPSA